LTWWFAASLGFEVNRWDSWRGSAVMELGPQDKIIITRGTDGHYVYFSVKENHSGTVIDLAKRYVSQNFGETGHRTLKSTASGRISDAGGAALKTKTGRAAQGRACFSMLCAR
jgi:hypothetical protein